MIPLAKNIKRYFSLKEFIIVALAVVISVSAGVGVFAYLKKEVVINDDGRTAVVKTMKTTVKEVLDQNGISITSDDYISVPLDSKLQKIKKNIINIKRAIPVYILADGQKTKVMTYKDTVGEAIANSSITMGEKDRLDGIELDSKVSRDLEIKIVRVKEEFVTEDTPVPFKVVSRESNQLDKGTKKVVREGKEGVREKTFKVVYEDGKQILRQMVNDVIASAPVDKIVEIGTVLNFKTSRGETVRYKKVIEARATAYTASYADTGKSPGDPGFGVTYTGMKVKKGVIAVDPKVIPLGTRVYVQCAGSTPDYGYAIAADIGGAIKGNKIDLYFEDGKTSSRWGVKNVKVYILLNN